MPCRKGGRLIPLKGKIDRKPLAAMKETEVVPRATGAAE